MPEVPIVLLVEDDEPLQEIVHDALEAGGFDLLRTASGEEALLLLASGVVNYSALVTDINLGGATSGWGIARRAREIEPGLAVVYITGAAGDQWPAQGVPNSILIQKPFAPAQLVTALAQLLNKSAST
ncbi:MAG: response regulator [Acetobacteraceae bacterium]|nr:response regulator [Acetobacteraceae bacterium]